MLRLNIPQLKYGRYKIPARIFSTLTKPFKVAVVGSGPAGFYSAYRLLDKLPEAQVDMYESQPVPFGLARFGVAPDHPEVKNCEEKFTEVAAGPNFRFIGNVKIGTDNLPISALRDNYNAILLSYGSSEDRSLNVAGEQLPGVYSARQFVGWYNGLPELSNLNPPLEGVEDVSIIGNGNVALDVARILLTDVRELKSTDITETAYECLKTSKVKNVRIIGRRGFLQSAFTTKEVRELTRLSGVAMRPLNKAYLEEYEPFMPHLKRPIQRMYKVLQDAEAKYAEPEDPSLKHWELDYLLSPVEFYKNMRNDNLLSSVKCEINTLLQTDIDSPAVASGTGQYKLFKTELAFRSIGYKSVAISGSEEAGIPFDTRKGIVPNEDGRAVNNTDEHSPTIPGVYVCGWIKSGSTGVIANTMMESFQVAENIIEDYHNHKVDRTLKGGYEALKHLIKSRPVSWSDWLKIDAAESERGKLLGKPRVKFTSINEMLAILD